MAADSPVPKRENLRRAIRWLSDHGEYTLEAIDEASRRFDLTPLDEQFLMDHFRQSLHSGPGGAGSG